MKSSKAEERPTPPATLTSWMRQQVDWILEPVGAFLNRLGIHPNMLTIAGLSGNVFGAWLLSQGYFFWGGIVIMLMAPVDALDGATARARGESSNWGAFVDSTTDRFTEAITFLGLLYYYFSHGDTISNAALYTILVYLAFVGSVMVSYTRARAESLGFNASIGILSRLERYFILVPLLIIGQPEIALWIIAVLGNLTALQRIIHVRKQHYAANPSDKGMIKQLFEE